MTFTALQRKVNQIMARFPSSGGYIPTTFVPTHHASGGWVPTVTTAPSTDFKGAPFDLALGEVYGMRMWKMDGYGRLRARNWDKAPPWKPGVNEAKCYATGGNVVDPTGRGRTALQLETSYETVASSGGLISAAPIYKITWDDGSTETTRNVEYSGNKHAVPDENCQCGFYAYSDSKHAETKPYKSEHVILGIVRGTGRTLIGTKGFRCEKAEIVALRRPKKPQQLAHLERVYPDVPLLESRSALLEFAPLTNTLPDPSSEDFWNLP
jgi:hypothetical protein